MYINRGTLSNDGRISKSDKIHGFKFTTPSGFVDVERCQLCTGVLMDDFDRSFWVIQEKKTNVL